VLGRAASREAQRPIAGVAARDHRRRAPLCTNISHMTFGGLTITHQYQNPFQTFEAPLVSHLTSDYGQGTTAERSEKSQSTQPKITSNKNNHPQILKEQ